VNESEALWRQSQNCSATLVGNAAATMNSALAVRRDDVKYDREKSHNLIKSCKVK